MSKNTPSHLRIHSENDQTSADAPKPLKDDIAAFMNAFTQATGWAIKNSKPSSAPPAPKNDARTANSSKRDWELVEAIPIDTISDAEDLLSLPMVAQQDAEKLFDSIQTLIDRLEKSEQAIRRQEAELATNVGVSWKPSEQDELAARLEEILQGAGNAIHASAGALYLLDENTSSLKMRSCWGLPTSKLAEESRPLRGSLADLEALLGNAVMLEDTAMSPEWRNPEDFPSAICVPIGSPTMPHGTLWFWSDEVRQYSSTEIEVANLASGRLMSELERSVMGQEVQHSRVIHKQLDTAGLAQASRLPSSQPLHKDFEVDGWTFQDGSLGGGFHDWDVSPKGHMMLAVGQATQTGPAGSLVAASAQSIIRAHWPTIQLPAPLLRTVNDVLWGHMDSDWTTAMSLFQINPLTGHGCMSSAGSTQTFIVSHRGYRPIGQASPRLGLQPDPTYANTRFVLQPGEVLISFSGTVVEQAKGGKGKKIKQTIDQESLLQTVRNMLDDTASDIAGQLARLLPAIVTKDHTGTDRSMIVLRNVRKV